MSTEAKLQRQDDRLELLLNLTSRITSNLDLREVLRATSANIRDVVHADAAGVAFFDEKSNKSRIYAVDFPDAKGFVKEELVVTAGNALKRAWGTSKAVILSGNDREELGPEIYELVVAEGLDVHCLIPLVSRSRPVGVLILARRHQNLFTSEDVDFLARASGQIAIGIENALAFQKASGLGDRLRLLLDLTTRITSSLELRDVLRSVGANIRELVHADGVTVSLPDAASGKFRVFATDFPHGKGVIMEELLCSLTAEAKKAIDTLQPIVFDPRERDEQESEPYDIAAAEGLKAVCSIPLVDRGRALGILSILRTSETPFTQEDVDFLSQASGQIAIAIENALAYREISELKDKLAQEKVYLEEEFRSEMGFEQIIGNSSGLKHVLQMVETAAPSDATILLLGETGTGKELIARAIHDRSRRKQRTFVKLNCAAIPTGLVESELFGHEKGGNPQTRTYAYDGLSRMMWESNPESNGTVYTYDAPTSNCTNSVWNANDPGKLVQKQDGNGSVTCYMYDALGRLNTVLVATGPGSGATSGCKSFFYDNSSGLLGSRPSGVSPQNTLGRLVEAVAGNCSWPPTQSTIVADEWFSYTPRGEVSDVWESTPHSGGYYHSSATYWANGALNVLTDSPTGYYLAYSVDGEGRVYSTTDGGGAHPLASTNYNSASQPTQLSLGYSGDSDGYNYDPNTGRMTQYQFNVNGQSVVGNLTWNANGTLSALGITDPFNSSDTQSCTYAHDDLVRISSANCGSIWSQTFSYDAFGNITKAGSSSFNPSYSSATNRMTQIGSSTPSYDADGNVTNDFLHSYTWDAYGRPISVTNDVSGASASITYDALGRVAERNINGAYTQMIYSPTGFLMTIMTGSTYLHSFSPMPGGGATVWSSPNQIWYRHADWLGSSRLATTTSRTVYGDVAYAPFGETYAQSGAADFSFTGQDQDTDTSANPASLYDFPAREYGIQGRWPSPDPSGLAAVDPSNPQSWNRYAYVLNNPLATTDPTGLGNCPPPTSTSICVSADPPSSVCDPSWTSCGIGGSGGDSGSTPGVVGPTYCGGNPQCGKSDSATCVAKAIADGRSPAACTGAPAGGSTPGASQPNQSYAQCVKDGGDFLSLQNGLQAITGGYLGNGWLSSALLGNSFSNGIGFFQALGQGNMGGAGKAAAAEALSRGGGPAAVAAASHVPNLSGSFAVSVSIQTATTSLSAGAGAEFSFATGTFARIGAGLLSAGLETVGQLKDPIDLAATGFAAFVCGLGR
jgi:RHS repeat-associated protein